VPPKLPSPFRARTTGAPGLDSETWDTTNLNQLVASGHDFSRAIQASKRSWALAPAGTAGAVGQGFSPDNQSYETVRALAPEACFSRAALLLLLFALASFLPAQEPTFRIDTKLVNLWVNVTDQTGAIVGTLKKEDFKIAEDGRPQDIAIFERQSEQPLAIILAIDTSASTFKDRALEQDAGKRFVHAILRSQDQMSVIQFATNVSMLVDFTNKPDRLDRGLSSLKSGEATALYEAIGDASDELAKKQGRKVLVLVSDGGDTAKSTTYDQALRQALTGEVMIYSIIDVPIEESAGRDLGGEHALITLSEQTGGKHFYASSGGLNKAFAQVSDDLRTQYLIGYYPHHQAPGVDFHRVSVSIPRAAADSFNIRYRAGYYADPPPKPRHIPVD
jgi:Ca-activated chloride channel family protein